MYNNAIPARLLFLIPWIAASSHSVPTSSTSDLFYNLAISLDKASGKINMKCFGQNC